MSLSVRPKPYIIPEYSLTGDLLAYLTCGLQYRYHNRGALSPSRPVQLWFGEFIHGVMEEAFRRWQANEAARRFPWSWRTDIRPIETLISQRLRARGMSPTPKLFCPYDATYESKGACPDPSHPHQLIASERAKEAINTWGKYLFPLISEAEVHLKAVRPLPGYQPGRSRADYYGVTGIIDVISSVNVFSAPSGNLILHYLLNDQRVKAVIESSDASNFEIIIDYKGMRRPGINDHAWQYHRWQVLTYAWLRAQRPHAKPVAGILFYLNELVPSREDLEQLRCETISKQTDILPVGRNYQAVVNWRPGTWPPSLTRAFKEQRSIRIVHIDEASIQQSLAKFDRVVAEIEANIAREVSGVPVRCSWTPKPDARTCTACDFKTVCPNPAPGPYPPTVP